MRDPRVRTPNDRHWRVRACLRGCVPAWVRATSAVRKGAGLALSTILFTRATRVNVANVRQRAPRDDGRCTIPLFFFSLLFSHSARKMPRDKARPRGGPPRLISVANVSRADEWLALVGAGAKAPRGRDSVFPTNDGQRVHAVTRRCCEKKTYLRRAIVRRPVVRQDKRGSSRITGSCECARLAEYPRNLLVKDVHFDTTADCSDYDGVAERSLR